MHRIRGCRRRGRAAHREPRSRPDEALAGQPPHRRPARPPPATPRLPFRRKKDMAGPGSGRRARGDCRGEGPAPLIQQLAGTSGSAGAAALARKQPLLPGVGAAASSGCPGSCCRHVINKPPARSSGPSARGASREAPAPPPPRRTSSRGAGARARRAHVTRRPCVPEPFPRVAPGGGGVSSLSLFLQRRSAAFSLSFAKWQGLTGSFTLPGLPDTPESQQDEESRAAIFSYGVPEAPSLKVTSGRKEKEK